MQTAECEYTSSDTLPCRKVSLEALPELTWGVLLSGVTGVAMWGVLQGTSHLLFMA